MQWSDVITPPSKSHLRQFAGLWLGVFLAMAAWRAYGGRADTTAAVIAAAAVLVGIPGLIFPALVRPIYTGWMVAAFPIGWTVSRLALGTIYFAVITPVAAVFTWTGRDLLRLKRRAEKTYWTDKRQSSDAREYMRQF